MKRAAKLMIILALMLFIPVCLFAANTTTQTYYTKVNIWYENPEKIPSTNYHRGAIIPYGTKVTITSQVKEKINFTAEDQPGINFTLINIPRHSLVSASELFKQYFSQDDPKTNKTEFNKFSAREKECIENGTLVEGISKEAAIAAYGYPPKHRTPALTSNLWTYWDAKIMKKLVTFKNNTVTKIEEVKEEYEGRPTWHYYVP